MEKQIRRFKVNFDFNWTYGVELKKLKSDIEELEKLGVTEVYIETEDYYGSPSVTIEAFAERIETDDEFKERIRMKEQTKKSFEQMELEQYERLKAKYDTKKK